MDELEEGEIVSDKTTIEIGLAVTIGFTMMLVIDEIFRILEQGKPKKKEKVDPPESENESLMPKLDD